MKKVPVEQRWEYLQSIGKNRYILFSVLEFGFAAVIVQCIRLLMGDIKTSADFFRNLVFDLIGFAVMGYIFGRLSWSRMEKESQLRKKKQKD